MQTNFDAIVISINHLRRNSNCARMFFLVTALCLLGCHGKEEVKVRPSNLPSTPPVTNTPIPTPQKCSSDSLIYEEVLHGKAREMERLEDLKVQVYTDKSQNLLIKIIELNGDYLDGASGIGNSSLKGLQKNKVIERCELMENKFPEFVIGTYDVSSTYGAEALFIIWCTGYEWNIIRTPFQAAILALKWFWKKKVLGTNMKVRCNQRL